ncbi:MAG TPA: S9 family peptidase [Anaerolineales bacterium]|nr:S9 family peptidase [Anaerolineales bacterium]
MDKPIKLTEKYERNGWPSIKRPDLKPPEGWNLSLLTSLERIRSQALSPDGKTIAYIKDGESFSDVYLLPLHGSWPARITADRPLANYWDDEIPVWSPDGKWIAFGMHGHIHLLPSEGGLPKKITDFATAASSPRFMPDSHGLIITVERNEIDQLLLTDIDGCWPRALTADTTGDHWEARPSPDGKSIVYLLRRFDDLNRLDVILLEMETGKSFTLYGKPSTRALSPKWSPDGGWIAFIAQETERDEIYLIRPDGEGLHQLTNTGHDVTQFEWSPDGKQLAVVFNRNGAFDLSLVEKETGVVVDLRSGAGIHADPNWSREGSFITYEYESPLLPPDLYRIDLPGKQVTQLTFSNPPAMQKNKMVVPEIVSYKSYDGLEIPAFLYRPEKPNGAAILYPHGGPKDQYTFFWDDLAQYFTAKGYAYLAPNYRGSTGYGKQFERANYDNWGIGDTQDCLYGARFLHSFKHGFTTIRPEGIGIAGGSYGGYMAICALARDPEYLFACGISKYGDSDLLSSWAQCEKRLRYYTEIFLGHPAVNSSFYRKGSPIADVKNVQKPMLILHGLLDTIVPPEASEEWVEALKRHDKVFEYKTYDNEPHGFLRRENLLDVYERMERFLDWYLLPR